MDIELEGRGFDGAIGMPANRSQHKALNSRPNSETREAPTLVKLTLANRPREVSVFLKDYSWIRNDDSFRLMPCFVSQGFVFES